MKEGFRGTGRHLPGAYKVLPQSSPKIPPRESMIWYWHPDRIGAHQRVAPRLFTEELEKIEGNLATSWSTWHEKWLVWMKAPYMQNKLCPGWKLLFTVEPNQLDQRVFARLYEASDRKWGNAKRYFDHVEKTMAREEEDRIRHSEQERGAMARETFRDMVQARSYAAVKRFEAVS